MATHSIEREILIEAPAEVVWGVITEPEQISRWFSDAADVGQRVGSAGTLTWKPGGRGGEKELDVVVPVTVVEADPYRLFAFRWNYADGASADEGNSALVEFSLTQEGQSTRLRVLESGIDAVTRDHQTEVRYRADHERGWEKHLGELLDYLASRPGEEKR